MKLTVDTEQYHLSHMDINQIRTLFKFKCHQNCRRISICSLFQIKVVASINFALKINVQNNKIK